jgi:hypothetical protein
LGVGLFFLLILFGRLKSLLTIGGRFPDLSEPLDFFKKAFDRDLARSSGWPVVLLYI